GTGEIWVLLLATTLLGPATGAGAGEGTCGVTVWGAGTWGGGTAACGDGGGGSVVPWSWDVSAGGRAFSPAPGGGGRGWGGPPVSGGRSGVRVGCVPLIGGVFCGLNPATATPPATCASSCTPLPARSLNCMRTTSGAAVLNGNRLVPVGLGV